MKVYLKRLGVVLGLVLFLGAAWSYAQTLRRGETMSLSVAEKRWGKRTFDAKVFREGSPEIRAQMAVDLIRSKIFLGKTTAKVREDLGSQDGHFFSDYYPAYILNEGWKSKVDTWQLLFLIDQKKQVKEVVIHKNCCDS